MNGMFSLIKGLWQKADAGDAAAEKQVIAPAPAAPKSRLILGGEGGEISLATFRRPEGMARRHFLAAMGITSTTVVLGGTSAVTGKDLWAGSDWKPESPALVWGDEIRPALRNCGFDPNMHLEEVARLAQLDRDRLVTDWTYAQIKDRVGMVTTPENMKRLSEGLHSAAKIVFGNHPWVEVEWASSKTPSREPEIIAGIDKVSETLINIRYEKKGVATLNL